MELGVQSTEGLMMCQTERDTLLSEERRCVDEIACDRLAIEKMEAFNAKSIRNVSPERIDDRRFYIERRRVLEKSLTLLDQPVDEWREYLDALQLHRQKVRRYRLFELQTERRNCWQKISQLQEKRIVRQAEFVKAHEQFVAREVRQQFH